MNRSLPWSVSFIEKYESMLFEEENSHEDMNENEELWERAFKPYLEDALIEEVMKKIRKRNT